MTRGGRRAEPNEGAGQSLPIWEDLVLLDITGAGPLAGLGSQGPRFVRRYAKKGQTSNEVDARGPAPETKPRIRRARGRRAVTPTRLLGVLKEGLPLVSFEKG